MVLLCSSIFSAVASNNEILLNKSRRGWEEVPFQKKRKINDTCFIIFLPLLIFFSLSQFHLLTGILPKDINECEIDNGNCSNGTCVNTNGSFYCSCDKGFIMSEDDRYKCIGEYTKKSDIA
jgi:Calcium-binding EGF domain